MNLIRVIAAQMLQRLTIRFPPFLFHLHQNDEIDIKNQDQNSEEASGNILICKNHKSGLGTLLLKILEFNAVMHPNWYNKVLKKCSESAIYQRFTRTINT